MTGGSIEVIKLLKSDIDMKCLHKEAHLILLRLDKGEEIFSSLTSFCEAEKIFAGSFTALGACSEVTLSYYNIETRQYEDKEVVEDLEILAINGNIALMNEEIIIHAHGVFSNKAFQTTGGHLKSLTVSGTCEITLHPLSTRLKRAFDEETGLNLFK